VPPSSRARNPPRSGETPHVVALHSPRRIGFRSCWLVTQAVPECFSTVVARERSDRGNLGHRILISRLLRHPAVGGIPRNDVEASYSLVFPADSVLCSISEPHRSLTGFSQPSSKCYHSPNDSLYSGIAASGL
jgi:hypothetical protein